MSQNITPEVTSRRNFLKKFGITVGAAGAVTSLGLLSACVNDDDEMVSLLTTDGQTVQVKKSQLKVNLVEMQERGREGIPGKKYVMVIDLAKCLNARLCMAACQGAHHLKPEQHHINVLQMQNAEGTGFYYQPKPCMHCDNPPCTKVCPVDATFKRQDGIVLIDNERCIGCRFCIAACPYSARVFNWSEPKYVEGDENRVYDIELNVPQKKGTISKCLFSADQLRVGKLPYCVSACPNGTYWFGDANEDAVTNGTSKETVRLSTLLHENAAYTLMPELGTKPRVYYLPPKDRLFDYQNTEKNYLGEEEHGHHA
jgi:molybdopterin-containing oxidoreductase family iron-sulfur binding subunit